MIENISYKKICERKFDLCICFASFEKRCLSLSKKVDPQNIGKVYILINNHENEERIQENYCKLKNLYGEKAKEIHVDISDPIYTVDSIIENIILEYKNYEKIRVLLDISTFTHEILLMMLCLLRNISSKVELVCAYSNALDYCEGELVENKWLSKGIKNVRTVLGCSGDFLPTRKTHLIVIVGYEYERAFEIINSIEPNSLSLGYVCAEETSAEKNKDANIHYLALVEQMAISYAKIDKFTISCENVRRTVDTLKNVVKKHQEDNIIIVPLNNKVSTIGVALTVFDNQAIQVCYGQPVLYNRENYSIPGEKIYFYEFEQSDWNH